MTDRQKKSTRVIVEEKNPSGIPGTLTLNEDVVATVARLAAKDVDGVYSVGKTPFISLGDEHTRGVGVEVGMKEAAFDLDLVVVYGKDIRQVARQLREITAAEVNKMAGREVVEININVVDIKLPDEVEKKKTRVI